MTAPPAGPLARAEDRVWSSFGLEPTHHDVRLPSTGTTLHVTEVGDPAGPPVVFVHGTSVAAPSWVDLVALLPTHRCLLLDRPGCGRSEPTRTAGVADLLHLAETLVVDVMDGLGLDRASVLGTSYGGLFALRSAAAHPERVDRLVLLAWCLGMPGTTAPASLRLVSVPGLRRLPGLVPVSPRLVRALLGGFGMRRAVADGRFGDEAIAWLVTLYRETDTLRHEGDTAATVMSLRHGWDPGLTWSEELLAAVAAPSLLLCGDEDPFCTTADVRAVAEVMPDARAVIATEAGHAPWLDRPELCVAAIADHLASPTPG